MGMHFNELFDRIIFVKMQFKLVFNTQLKLENL